MTTPTPPSFAAVRPLRGPVAAMALLLSLALLPDAQAQGQSTAPAGSGPTGTTEAQQRTGGSKPGSIAMGEQDRELIED